MESRNRGQLQRPARLSIPKEINSLVVSKEKSSVSALKKGLLLWAGFLEEEIDGRTPLQVATQLGDRKKVKMLLKFGANPNNAPGNSGRTSLSGRSPLHIAAEFNQHEIAWLLLSFGAQPNIALSGPYFSGWTPLHFAAARGFIDVCAALLYWGASLNATDAKGKTPCEVACDKQVLPKAMARFKPPSANHRLRVLRDKEEEIYWNLIKSHGHEQEYIRKKAKAFRRGRKERLKPVPYEPQPRRTPSSRLAPSPLALLSSTSLKRPSTTMDLSASLRSLGMSVPDCGAPLLTRPRVPGLGESDDLGALKKRSLLPWRAKKTKSKGKKSAEKGKDSLSLAPLRLQEDTSSKRVESLLASDDATFNRLQQHACKRNMAGLVDAWRKLQALSAQPDSGRIGASSITRESDRRAHKESQRCRAIEFARFQISNFSQGTVFASKWASVDDEHMVEELKASLVMMMNYYNLLAGFNPQPITRSFSVF